MSIQIVLLAPFGQIGFELQRSLAALGRLHCLSRAQVDFANTAATVAAVAAYEPDIIVNAAAWTSVDKAETEITATYALNCELPKALAQLASTLKMRGRTCWLIHYSTDYVYSGDGDTPWQEDAPTQPLSVYGTSKLAGDLEVVANCHHYLIFRTSWVYAARGNNFMKTMLKLARQQSCLAVVGDQIGAPTPARLIANVTALALQRVLIDSKTDISNVIEKQLSVHKLSGIYHLSTSGETSWYHFAASIFKLAKQAGMELALMPEHFSVIMSADYPTVAKRPANSRLSLTKIERTFSITMPDWQSQLEQTISEWISLEFPTIVFEQKVDT